MDRALLELDKLVIIVHVHDPANKGHSRKSCLLSVEAKHVKGVGRGG